MKKLLILLNILILSACSKVEVSKLSTTDKIVAFGDSLTYGYGASKNSSYPSKLEQIINIKVVNEGINGNTTEDGLRRVDDLINKHNPQLILLGLGGNDMLRKIPEQTTVNNLRLLIKKIKEKNIQVILLATPKPSILGSIGYLKDASFYEKLAKEENVLLIENIYSDFLSKSEYRSDLIHLNDKGYELVAKEIAKFLEDNNITN